MATRNISLPEFSLPDPGLRFLASSENLYEYSNLYGFCSRLKEMLKNFTISENHPLALLSKNSEELIFVIAACYLLNIPFIPISPTVTDRELKNKIRKLKPGAFFYR